jgi:hypothetical protein
MKKELYQNVHNFGQAFVKKYGNYTVTPYIHVVVCHTKELMEANGSIGLFSQQGFEATHKKIENVFTLHDKRWRKVLQNHYRTDSPQRISN